MRHQRRAQPAAAPGVQLRADGGKGSVRLSGYAAVYYDGTPGTEYVMRFPWGDELVERLQPGCFADVLRTADVRCCYNHSPDFVLARTKSGTLRLSTDKRGLFYDATIDRDSPLAAAVLSAVARGDVQGSSFSFDYGETVLREIRGGADDEDGTTILEVVSVSYLADVGPVSWPAYTSTTAAVDGERSAGRSQPPRFVPRDGRRFHHPLPSDPARRRVVMAARLVELDI